MKDYQRRFLELALECGALRLGRFTLKSGRESPYFFDIGLFNTGARLKALGDFYAEAIVQSGLECEVLFGPAYKGIPLVCTAAIALAQRGRDMPFAFNRKEAKDHGEGGRVVGAPLRGRVLIVDDVISAGLSVEASVEIIQSEGAVPCGVVIALDRQERGKGERSALEEVERAYGIPVVSIVRLEEMIEYLREIPGKAPWVEKIASYRRRYGAM
ncbi:MAG: orotate phosphoribosyltransferase [Gammaproteobacteria bacterium]|nr:MAG: orotate phosphoribosyltransferase [Gammaproteobacteria bacterium]